MIPPLERAATGRAGIRRRARAAARRARARRRVVALDLFAGTGWGVACRWLDVVEHGVDNMTAVQETRALNGMSLAYADVWDGLEGRADVPIHTLQIASPPCQKFSTAGKGTGRSATDEVLRLIAEGAYMRPEDMRTFAAQHEDDGIALVLAPLAYAVRYRPTAIAWEQVPPVLPVWEACAHVLRALGYSVWTGNVQAEQYGVPQTRKRAVLLASSERTVGRPEPTHSRYHARTPERLDPGMPRWVSMAEALGWGTSESVGWPRMSDRPHQAVTIDGVDYRARDLRPGDHPSPTLTSKARSWQRLGVSEPPHGDETAYRASTQENAAVRGIAEPAPTVMFGARSNDVSWVEREAPHGDSTGYLGAGPGSEARGVQQPRGVDEPAHTITALANGSWVDRDVAVERVDREAVVREVRARLRQQSETLFDLEWPADRPSLTVATRDLIPHPGETSNRYNKSTKSRNDGVRVSPEEAAILQSYPRGFRFAGARTKQYEQIGNAVPPLLARACLAEVLGVAL